MKVFFSAINLGCSKNLIETQHVIGHLLKLGQESAHYDVIYNADPYDKQVKYVFVNTCGFLSSGRKEMVDTIHDLVARRKKVVYAFGCGVQYFHKDYEGIYKDDRSYEERNFLLSQYGGRNIFLLTWSDLDALTIEKMLSGWQSSVFCDFTYSSEPRAYTNIHYGFEYVKIAEGCSSGCSFCIIPKLRGKQKSRPIEEIVCEVERLVSFGAREIILLAQDTAKYGIDLYGRYTLMDLIFALEELKGDFHYRILYMYPDVFTKNRLEKLVRCKKFIPYFDIPFQHVSSRVLKRMRRFYGGGESDFHASQGEICEKEATDRIVSLVSYIRALFPVCYIRTNFIIGFPGETEEDHAMLLEVLQKRLFDSVTLFAYHDEPLAESSMLSGKVPEEVIEKRFLQAKRVRAKVQKTMSTRRMKNHENRGYVVGIKGNKSLLSKISKSSVDSDVSGITLIVRPWLHAPDIDEVVEIPLHAVREVLDGKDVEIGSRIKWSN